MKLLADLLLLAFFTGILFSPVALSFLCVNPALGQTNDNGAAFGAQDVVISGVTWTVDSMSFERMSRFVVINDSRGRPKRQFGTEEIPLLPITLQWVGNASGSGTDGTGMGGPTVSPPALFVEFTTTINGVTVTWILEKVGAVFTANGEAKINCGARYKLG